MLATIIMNKDKDKPAPELVEIADSLHKALKLSDKDEKTAKLHELRAEANSYNFQGGSKVAAALLLAGFAAIAASALLVYVLPVAFAYVAVPGYLFWGGVGSILLGGITSGGPEGARRTDQAQTLVSTIDRLTSGISAKTGTELEHSATFETSIKEACNKSFSPQQRFEKLQQALAQNNTPQPAPGV